MIYQFDSFMSLKALLQQLKALMILWLIDNPVTQ